MPTQQWDEFVDLVVIGSGAAGLAAAITGAHTGAKVIVLEQSESIGGTTATSGGLLWVPLNPKAHEVGFVDSRDQAITYLLEAAGEPSDRLVLEAYVDHAAPTVQFLEAASPVRFRNVPYPDTFAELPGGTASGRHIEAKPFPAQSLGVWRERLRRTLSPLPLTLGEVFGTGLASRPRQAVFRNMPRILWRRFRKHLTGGNGLAGALLRGALNQGVTFCLRTRAIELLQDDLRRITGVIAETKDGQKMRIGARAGVILANGGFEWDSEVVRQNLPIAPSLPASPPLAKGDNLRLARQVDAMMNRLNEYWHWPATQIPGVAQDGQPTASLVMAERSMPHSLWVNSRGQRFVNETAHNAAFAFHERDLATGALVNLPAWSIVDAQYRAKYPLTGRIPGQPDPAWVVRADRLADLATRIGVDPAGLESTVHRFNAMARDGRDSQFGRGSSIYDRFFGDRRAKNPNLGTIEYPPFYAIPMLASTVGTRGGPKTTDRAQVVRSDGKPIVGLYAAGNAATCCYGPNMIAGGATIMPALTFGRLASRHALGFND